MWRTICLGHNWTHKSTEPHSVLCCIIFSRTKYSNRNIVQQKTAVCGGEQEGICCWASFRHSPLPAPLSFLPGKYSSSHCYICVITRFCFFVCFFKQISASHIMTHRESRKGMRGASPCNEKNPRRSLNCYFLTICLAAYVLLHIVMWSFIQIVVCSNWRTTLHVTCSSLYFYSVHSSHISETSIWKEEFLLSEISLTKANHVIDVIVGNSTAAVSLLLHLALRLGLEQEFHHHA